MKAVKVILKVISYIIISILMIILALNIFTIIQRNVMKQENPAIFGYSMSVVISGSMSPAIEVNDAIIVKKDDEYEKGEIILFRDNNSFIAHRIADVRDEGYVTRGDANNIDDDHIVEKEDVVGKVVFTVPHLGVVTGFVQSPLGMMCMFILLVVLLELPKLLKRR